MTASNRILALMLTDILSILVSGVGAIFLRFDMNIPDLLLPRVLLLAVIEVPVRIVIYSYFGLYNKLWRYASVRETFLIAWAVSIGSLVMSLSLFTGLLTGLPRSYILLSWMLNLLFMGASRYSLRVREEFVNKRSGLLAKTESGYKVFIKRVLIVGAGSAGNLILKEIYRQSRREYDPVGFVDDDKNKKGFNMNGIPVIGTTEDLGELIRGYSIDEVFITMPSADGDKIRLIVEMCNAARVKVRILPRFYDIIDGKLNLGSVRDVDIEDLLGRDEIKIDLEEITGYLAGEVVLVTGAGGTIGSELCRQISRFYPRRLILLGHGENSIYNIDIELRERYPGLEVIPVIADIQDKARIDQIFEDYKPSIIFHAAAHKHVPLMEMNPIEAIKNNVFGTKNVAEAADRVGAKRLVMLSTDKSVNPTSIMGASKRLAEFVIQIISQRSKTRFVAVRFGNVLGSRGSVIPLFKKQIQKGGPITVTHPDMKRYFMTIPEAVQLVIQAGAMGKGGEIFVLDMGEPVKIVDMARDLIYLSGLEPDVDIQIVYTGIRPGEKLFEELLTAEEGTEATKHERIYIAKGSVPFEGEVDDMQTTVEEIAAGRDSRWHDVREYVNSLLKESVKAEA